MRLALAQINTTVGDLDRNRERILRAVDEARSAGADLVLLPELAVTGYPPEDLLLRPGFVRAAAESLREIARETRGIVALVGFPHFDRDLYNACAVCVDGELTAIYRKRFLPNYGVFDEDRYFAPARAPGFEEALLGVDVEPAEAVGRRLRDLRRRALARERQALPDATVVSIGSPPGQGGGGQTPPPPPAA